MAEKIKTQPAAVFAEYKKGNTYKAGIGSRGIYEQSKINERFYVGDQWHGAKCGNDRPLVRHNVIKRIGEYKIACVSAAPVTAVFSCDGVPNTVDIKENIAGDRKILSENPQLMNRVQGTPDNLEINLIMSALTDYQRVTAERLRFNEITAQALHNAYVSGTGIIYTYWDDTINTGLYADEARTTAIKGDIAVEVLDVENVVFGAANRDDIQAQPYILIAQRRSVAELKREAKRFGVSKEDIEAIKPDRDTEHVLSGERGEQEDEGLYTTVITKLFKEYSDGGETRVFAVRVCEGATIRAKWDTGLTLYPLSKMSWERRKSSIYGDSEVTYLVPNQIAINKMLTSSVWSTIMQGMPMMYQNMDVVPDSISNAPGQLIKVYGGNENINNAVGYITPPNLTGNYDNAIASLIDKTMSMSGANDAALGNMRPDNMSAIIAVREAATMPLQCVQNRYYQFIEDTVKIWAEFWVRLYGDRSLKIDDENGIWYLPFKAERYRDFMICVKVDVGAATIWGEAQVIATLDNLYAAKIIDAVQYLKSMPKGYVPNVDNLIKEIKQSVASQAKTLQGNASGGAPVEQMQGGQQGVATADAAQGGAPTTDNGGVQENIFALLSDEERETFMSLPPEEQERIIQNAAAKMTA